jgi:hypothetical protein
MKLRIKRAWSLESKRESMISFPSEKEIAELVPSEPCAHPTYLDCLQ